MIYHLTTTCGCGSISGPPFRCNVCGAPMKFTPLTVSERIKHSWFFGV